MMVATAGEVVEDKNVDELEFVARSDNVNASLNGTRLCLVPGAVVTAVT